MRMALFSRRESEQGNKLYAIPPELIPEMPKVAEFIASGKTHPRYGYYSVCVIHKDNCETTDPFQCDCDNIRSSY